MKYALFALIGYLSGSVLYARIIAKCRQTDILSLSDDHNPGSANVFKLISPAAGVLATACDMLKAFAPIYASRFFLSPDSWGFALVIAAPVFGHAFPVFFGFHGGKAISAAFGTVLALTPDRRPFLILAALYLFFSLVIVVTPHHYRSVLTFSLFAYFMGRIKLIKSVAFGLALVSVLVIVRHCMAFKGGKMRVSFLGREGREKNDPPSRPMDI